MKIGHKPQSPQLVGSTPTLQNRRYSHIKRPASSERLASQVRIIECILHHLNSLGSSKVCHRAGSLSVRLCPVLSILCSWAFTKVLHTVAAFLWTLGVRVIVYIDNMLIMGKSPDVRGWRTPGFLKLFLCRRL